MVEPRQNTALSTTTAALAAFCTYFCMYAFRKPFTAGTFEGDELFGLGLKTVLVLSQLLGYLTSKFIGVKVVSEMPRHRRAIAIILLILFAELALIGFAVLPPELGVVMLFLNGLPLGMIFGLVLAYLEGRRHTEALAAGLCASFIISSGVVKSVGRSLVDDYGLTEFQMPFVTGLIFFGPLLVFVWLLQRTPPPSKADIKRRSVRDVMNRAQRWDFFRTYAFGLSLLLVVYVALTVIRTIRDDFGVEIWSALGVSEEPEVFAVSESVVACVVVALSAGAICITQNVAAIRAAVGLMCIGFAIVTMAVLGSTAAYMSAFVFMVVCGVGLYIPYVLFHTTIFERIVAASPLRGNIGFLMYLADSLGYLGYAVVIVWRSLDPTEFAILPFFRGALIVTSIGSLAAMLVALEYFRRVLPRGETEAEA